MEVFILRTISLHVAGPQREVVTQQLHDQRAVLVAFLGEGVQLRDRVVEGRLGQATRPVRTVEDLVVEHGEVQGQAEADRVRGRQFSHGDVARGFVRHQRVLGRLLAVVARGELRQVSVVITLKHNVFT